MAIPQFRYNCHGGLGFIGLRVLKDNTSEGVLGIALEGHRANFLRTNSQNPKP